MIEELLLEAVSLNDKKLLIPLILVVSLVVSIITTYIVVSQQRNLTRLRATLDFIDKAESDQHYLSLAINYYEIKGDNKLQYYLNLSPADIKKLSAKEKVESREKKQKLLWFLNHHELIAVSIKKKIIDKDFYKQWMGTGYVRVYLDCCTNITTMQDKRKKAFITFEKLAKSWDKGPWYKNLFN